MTKYSHFSEEIESFQKENKQTELLHQKLLWYLHSLHYDHIIYNDNNKQLERFPELKLNCTDRNA